MNPGFLAALAGVLVWGSYGVPFKKSPTSNPVQFQALMGVGVFLFAVFVVPFIKYTYEVNIFGLSAGFLWAIGNILSLPAIRSIGMSRAMPVWVSAVVISSFLQGVILFHELPAGLVVGLIGIVGICIGVFLVGTTGKSEGKTIRKGILFATAAGLFFGTCLTPLKLGNLTPSQFFFSMSLGIMIFAFGYALFKRLRFEKKALWQSITGGVLWNIGSLLSIITISYLGLSKGYPITQSAVLVAVLWGLLYFKEITAFKDKVKVFVGALVLLSGVFILALA